jgi:hypothetical protein
MLLLPTMATAGDLCCLPLWIWSPCRWPSFWYRRFCSTVCFSTARAATVGQAQRLPPAKIFNFQGFGGQRPPEVGAFEVWSARNMAVSQLDCAVPRRP